MKTIKTLALLLAVVVLVGCGDEKKADQAQTLNPESTQETETKAPATQPDVQDPTGDKNGDMQVTPSDEGTEAMSPEDLMNKGENLKCTYSMSVAGFDFTGTMYATEDKRLRMEQKSSNGDTTDVVFKDNFMYSWSNLKATTGIDAVIGTKMSLDTMKSFDKAAGGANTDNSQQTQQQVDIQQKMNMKCSAWTVDESKFQLPSGVNFTDVGELFKNFL